MLLLSFAVIEGRFTFTPGILTLLRLPIVPSFCTSQSRYSAVLSITFSAVSPSSINSVLPTGTSSIMLGYESETCSGVDRILISPITLILSPVLTTIFSPEAVAVVRISGPLVSIIIPMCEDTARTLVITLINPSSVMWAEFILTTLIPSLYNARIKSTSQRMSEIVATIFVFF